MNEVASDAALYLPRLRADGDVAAWASSGASALQELLSLSAAERERRVQRGREWAKRFDADRAIEGYLAIYARVLELGANRTDFQAGLSEGRRLWNCCMSCRAGIRTEVVRWREAVSEV